MYVRTLAALEKAPPSYVFVMLQHVIQAPYDGEKTCCMMLSKLLTIVRNTRHATELQQQ
jgi:hypothetical protein